MGPPIGDHPPVSRLFSEHVNAVWSTLRNMGVEVSLIDDAVQDVFLTVHRRLSTFEGRSSIKTWIYGIAVRVASDYRRKARVQRRYFWSVGAGTDGAEDSHPSPQGTPLGAPEDYLFRVQAVERLGRLLGRLKAVQREVFVLVDIQGLTIAEAAHALRIRPSTAHSRLQVARKDLNRMAARIRAEEEG